MSEDLGAYDLPAASESALDKATRAIANIGDNPTAITAGQKLAALADQATKFQVGGYTLSDLPSKAKEAGVALAASFGINVADAEKKLGAIGGALTSTVPGLPAMPEALITNANGLRKLEASTELSATQVKENINSTTLNKEHLITLRDDEGYVIEFTVMPEVVENRAAQYEPVAPPQFPGAFQKYKGTESVTWTLSATFISRNSAEASINLRNIFRLRGWVMPYYGLNTAADDLFKNKLGAPPPVLKLKGLRGLFGEVPVVITSMNWNWPRDVDYIPAWDPIDIGDEVDPQALGHPASDPTTPFPTVISITINMVESYSTTEFNNFDLRLFRLGKVAQAFGRPPVQTPPIRPSAEEAQTTPSRSPMSAPNVGPQLPTMSTPNVGPQLPAAISGAVAKATEVVKNTAATVAAYVRNPMSGADKAKGH